jgi:hypothetical protein
MRTARDRRSRHDMHIPGRAPRRHGRARPVAGEERASLAGDGVTVIASAWGLPAREVRIREGGRPSGSRKRDPTCLPYRSGVPPGPHGMPSINPLSS